MGWASTTQAYFVSGLTTDEISSDDMTTACGYSDDLLKNEIFVRHYEEDLNGNIDGTRTQFQTKKKPIADREANGSNLYDVDADDLEVYGINHNDDTGFDESTELTVSSVNARDGIITLSSAPSTDYDKIVGDFVCVNPQIKIDDVKLASSYLASHLAIMKGLGADIISGTPYSYKAGNFTMNKGGGGNESEFQLAGKMWNEYQTILIRMRLGKISKA